MAVIQSRSMVLDWRGEAGCDSECGLDSIGFLVWARLASLCRCAPEPLDSGVDYNGLAVTLLMILSSRMTVSIEWTLASGDVPIRIALLILNRSNLSWPR